METQKWLAEGQYFGEIGLLGRTERTATVIAVTEVECLAWNLAQVSLALMAFGRSLARRRSCAASSHVQR